MNKNIITTILLILLVSLLGYIIYDKVLNKGNEKTTINNNIDNIQKENNNEFENNNSNNVQNIEEINNIDIKKYEEIIETKLLKLLNNKSLKETSNQDILAIIFEMYKNEYGWKEEILKSDLEQIKQNSVIKNLNITYNDLEDYTMKSNYSASILYKINKEAYKYTNVGHSQNNIKIIYKELINSSTKDNEIIISYKYIFANTSSKSTKTTPGYHSLYYNLDDDKAFKEFSFMDINEEIGRAIAYDKAKMYIEENYNKIKDNLYTYNFIFTNENNDIILKDYYRE